MSEPLVSIISGYYNRENYVDDSINSLINQTYDNIEIIIFDDASTDNTYNKLKYFEYDERVIIIRHKNNIGFTAGLINAINISKGKYIAIHGSGDLSHKKRIYELVKFIEKNNNYDFVAPRFERIDEETNESIGLSNFSGKIYFNDFLNKARFTHGSVLYKRSSYDLAGGYEPTFTWVQDMDLFTRMLINGQGFVLDKVLYKQYTRKDGVTVNPSKLILQAKCEVLRRKLAQNITNRYSILANVNNVGIENYINNDDAYFQTIIYRKCLRVLTLGRILEYREIKKYLITERLYFGAKINFIIHDFLFNIISFFSINSKYVVNFFVIIKSIKNMIAKNYYRVKSQIDK